MSIQKPGSIFMKTPLELMNEMRAAEIRSDSKLKNALAVKDRQQAVQRYKWNLDPGSSGLEIGFDGLTLEAMLYERGIVGAGEVEPGVLDLFNVAWSGGIDRYRRMRNMKPIFPTGTDDKGRILEGAFDKEFEIVYLPFKSDERKGDKYGAVCYDYTPLFSKTGLIPRVSIQGEIIQEMSNLYNISLVNLFNSTALAVYNIGDADQRDAIEQELRSMTSDMLKGKYYQILKSNQEIQNLTNPASYNGQAYWETFNSLDNLRLGMLGHANNGTFNKKERKLENESNVESSNADLVNENSIVERERFANALNSIYGVNFSVESVSEEEEVMAEEDAQDMDKSEGVISYDVSKNE